MSIRPVSRETRIKYQRVGVNISCYRRLAGLTQEELAERVGISRSHLSAIEAPQVLRPFSLEILFLIADSLHIPPEKLLEGTMA